MIDNNFLKGALVACLLRGLSFLPFSVLQKLGTLLGWFLYVFKSRSRYVTECNLRHCFPAATRAQLNQLAKASLQESSKTALEMAALWHWSCEKINRLIQAVHGQELFVQALQNKRGVILMVPHLGNWELTGFFAVQHSAVTSLYAPAKWNALDKLMYEGRIRNGSHLVPTSATGVRALLKALKRGETVIVLPDQVPEAGNGVFAPFFNQPALTMTLLASLARRTGAVVLCCHAKRRGDGKGFDIVLSPVAEGIYSEDELAAATALNQSVEHCVMECVEQYQWEYKRFRKCPPGGKRIY